MRNIIRQTESLPAPAETLFRMYLDPKAHGAITGAPVVIGDQRGDDFRAFDGALTGSMLEVVEPRLIVQSWRSTEFETRDPDSTLILSFTPEADGGRIDLIHLDVPDQDYEAVVLGWGKFYWDPWRRYLQPKAGTGKKTTAPIRGRS